jgi:uncharacterized protein (DUF58 family)
MTGSGSTRGSEGGIRRRYHFHTPGVLYILVILFIAIGALNSQNNLLFTALGLAIGGLVVSGVLSGGALLGVRMERALPVGSAHVGERVRVRYRLRNHNRLVPAFGLNVMEVESGESSSSGSIQRPRAFVPFVPAKGEVESEALVEARRRGVVQLEEVRAWSTFPFGLAKKSITIAQPARIVVYPVSLPVRRGVLERLTARSLSGVGAALQPGMGEELYGIREYSEGDNPRMIAWRRSARTGQLVVRQNTTPSPRKLWVVLRLERGGDPLAAETAVAMASSLIGVCASEGAAVGLCVPGVRNSIGRESDESNVEANRGIVVPPRASARSIRGMLELLAELNVAVADAVEFPSAAIRGGASVVIHAGEVDRGFGSARSVHIGWRDVERWLTPGEALERAKKRLAASVAEPEAAPRRGWWPRAVNSGGKQA